MREQHWNINLALLAVTVSMLAGGRSARGDLVIQTNTSSPTLITASFPESQSDGVGFIRIPIGNANVPNLAITTGVVFENNPQPFTAGTDPLKKDTANDAVTGSGDTGDCDKKKLLPSNTPFRTEGAFCTFFLGVDVGDADPTDKVNPQVDSGEWFVEVVIPWTRADGQKFTSFVNVDVTIFDDPVPEPGTVLETGVACVCIVASTHRRMKCERELT